MLNLILSILILILQGVILYFLLKPTGRAEVTRIFSRKAKIIDISNPLDNIDI